MKPDKTTSVSNYISACPEETQKRLQKIRELILSIVPDAIESISYGMPAYKQHGRPLVYFAAFKNHVGFYALPNGNTAFKLELKAYKTGKGSIQFPNDQAIPIELIEKIIRFRVLENK